MGVMFCFQFVNECESKFLAFFFLRMQEETIGPSAAPPAQLQQTRSMKKRRRGFSRTQHIHTSAYVSHSLTEWMQVSQREP